MDPLVHESSSVDCSAGFGALHPVMKTLETSCDPRSGAVDRQALVERTDRVLCWAKTNGTNQVVLGRRDPTLSRPARRKLESRQSAVRDRATIREAGLAAWEDEGGGLAAVAGG
jgi:hypothetical protein